MVHTRTCLIAAVSGSSPAPRLGNGDLAALAQLGSKPGTPFEGRIFSQTLVPCSCKFANSVPGCQGPHRPGSAHQQQAATLAVLNSQCFSASFVGHWVYVLHIDRRVVWLELIDAKSTHTLHVCCSRFTSPGCSQSCCPTSSTGGASSTYTTPSAATPPGCHEWHCRSQPTTFSSSGSSSSCGTAPTAVCSKHEPSAGWQSHAVARVYGSLHSSVPSSTHVTTECGYGSRNQPTIGSLASSSSSSLGSVCLTWSTKLTAAYACSSHAAAIGRYAWTL